MKINRRAFTTASLLAGQATGQTPSPRQITHGPFLGHVTENSVWVWGRTQRSGTLKVLCGKTADAMTLAASAPTVLEKDNSAWVEIRGLDSNTKYFVTFEGEGAPVGSFRTLPRPEDFRDADTNPKGLFNFSFAFGSCAHQRPPTSLGAELYTYQNLNRHHADKTLFSIMNGDWLYEEKRDYPLEAWRQQVGIAEKDTPAILRLAPSLTGVWENYKLYLERGVALAEWHRKVPGYFTPDDHEILNDVFGTGTPGIATKEAVFRDIALRAWYDYIAGSNPVATKQGILFGEAQVQAGSDVLYDPLADFTKLNLAEAGTLHIHWGGQLAGVVPKRNEPKGHPNAGVYGIVNVIDKNRLRITPSVKETATCAYSIGRHGYAKFRVGNVEVYLLDTRGLREMHDVENPARKGMSMLSKRQTDWIKNSMASSDADFFFLASTVDLMIPHVGTPGSKDPIKGKDDAWTAFLDEREDMIRFWDSLGKPVGILTGDLHNSWSIKVTDRVWEFASGPHNSQNHPSISEGSRPPNGKFDSRGRECEIRWSSYMRNDVPGPLRQWPIYAIASINNVFPNPTAKDKIRWVAYPRPQAVIQWYDGLSGNLLYAEPLHAALAADGLAPRRPV
ncbi:MAG: alkaline phosphatase D family protein [Bryobacter sp.]|nr:alkaline phosphatase D family protein [Bryobacter sp.]